jgi:hypothetical protein
MTLQLFHSEFPYTVYEENFIFFFISVSTIQPCHKAWAGINHKLSGYDSAKLDSKMFSN